MGDAAPPQLGAVAVVAALICAASLALVLAPRGASGADGPQVDVKRVGYVTTSTGEGRVVALYEPRSVGACVPEALVVEVAARSYVVTELGVDARAGEGFDDLQCRILTGDVSLFDADSSAIGATIQVNGSLFTVDRELYPSPIGGPVPGGD